MKSFHLFINNVDNIKKKKHNYKTCQSVKREPILLSDINRTSSSYECDILSKFSHSSRKYTWITGKDSLKKSHWKNSVRPFRYVVSVRVLTTFKRVTRMFSCDFQTR